MMADYMRLRQICLVAPHLEPVISDMASIMGLSICYRIVRDHGGEIRVESRPGLGSRFTVAIPAAR